MKASSSVVFLLLLLLFLQLASQSPIRSPQSLLEVLREELAALVPDNEGDPPSLPKDSFVRLLGMPRPFLPRGDISGPSVAPPDHALALLFDDLLHAQKKFRGRAKKIMGPQGCFGIKLDRIGTLSGLGC